MDLTNSSLHEENDYVNQLFHNASTKSFGTSSLDLAQSLGIDAARVRNDREQTLLHVAAGYGKRRLVDSLINRGAKVNAQDIDGQAPLHYACNHAHKSVADILIQAGADVNLVDFKGWSPLDFTLARKDNLPRVSEKYWEVVELLLLNGADPYKKSLSGKSCLDRVKDREQRLGIRLLHVKKRLNNCDEPALRIAIADRYIREKDFFELIKRGDDELETVKKILTPRFVKSRLESFDNITPLHRAAGYNHLEVAKLLIKNGADVNATDDHGQVPLHNAARYGHVEMIGLLISQGCYVNTQDIDGMSPIHVAASSGSSFACVRLTNSGANISVRNSNGELPFDLAETDDVREVLKIEDIPMEIVSNPQSSSEQAIYMRLPENDGSPSCRKHSLLADQLQDELMLNSRSQERLFGNPNHTIKKIILNETDPRYQLIKQRMLTTIRHHSSDNGGHFSTYDIITIERILHERVWQLYKKRCEILDLENGPRAERLLFHGSSCIERIHTKGFDHRYAQQNGMFGAGIYFAADSSKSNQYTFGFGNGCTKHNDKSCYICERKMIYAQVALGKTFESKQAMPELSHPPPGFWSVTGEPGVTKDLQYPEYVIYDGHQAYPLYVITYRIKP